MAGMSSLREIGPELPALARAAIAAELTGTSVALPAVELPRAPVFVTLRTQGGDLRGCIGTISAIEPDVARETMRNAVLSATQDPRFGPVTAAELAGPGRAAEADDVEAAEAGEVRRRGRARIGEARDLEAGDYDMLVRGSSATHEEVVGRYWLRIRPGA